MTKRVGPSEAAPNSDTQEDTRPRRFQILSLDGGGMKGLFTAALLAELERDLGSPILRSFDLIAGTSTGGLIALALGAGYTPQEILDFYVDSAPGAFRRPASGLKRLIRPKHKPEPLLSTLEKLLGDRLVGNSQVRLLIPAYSLDGNDVYIFKTSHHPSLTRDWQERMVDVALATTAAPTYFPPASVRHNLMIDGGIWANNPALVAVAEAVGLLGKPLSSISLLSLGTSDEHQPAVSPLTEAGLFGWWRHGRGLLLRAPSVGSFHAAKYLLDSGSACRIDASVPKGVFRLDRIDETRLRGLAEHTARRYSRRVAGFLDHEASPFISCHGPQGRRDN